MSQIIKISPERKNTTEKYLIYLHRYEFNIVRMLFRIDSTIWDIDQGWLVWEQGTITLEEIDYIHKQICQSN